jgi:hypothetical protein
MKYEECCEHLSLMHIQHWYIPEDFHIVIGVSFSKVPLPFQALSPLFRGGLPELNIS